MSYDLSIRDEILSLRSKWQSARVVPTAICHCSHPQAQEKVILGAGSDSLAAGKISLKPTSTDNHSELLHSLTALSGHIRNRSFGMPLPSMMFVSVPNGSCLPL